MSGARCFNLLSLRLLSSTGEHSRAVDVSDGDGCSFVVIRANPGVFALLGLPRRPILAVAFVLLLHLLYLLFKICGKRRD
jgi:hypothetical protein